MRLPEFDSGGLFLYGSTADEILNVATVKGNMGIM